MVSFERSNRIAHAKIGNVSRSGLRLILSRPVTIATRIEVELPGMIVAGETRYCRAEGPGSFEVGMKIAGVDQR